MGTLVRIPKPLLVIILIFIVMWAFLSLEYYPTWDAAFYYGYTRSTIFDGDLKIDNDLRLSYPTATDDFVDRGIDKRTTETGRVTAPYAVGSSLIWLPWFVIIRGGAAIGQWLGFLPQTLTGYEWFFALAISSLSALLGLFAFWFGYMVAERESSESSALVATITMLFVTPLIYYQFREPLYSHATSAFVSGIVIYLWWLSYRDTPSYKKAIVLGGAIGLTALVRWQNIAYILLPFISAVWWWLDLDPLQRRESVKRLLGYLALVTLCVLFVLSVQMTHWRIVYGSWITVPQGDSFVDWSASYFSEVLFSPFRGLLPWMPVAFLSVVGLILVAKRKARLVVPLLILLAVSIYVNSSTQDWFAGGGYGPRRFSSELAILIIGYSGLIEVISPRFRRATAALLGILLFLHQWILFRFGLEEQIGGRVVSMAPDYQWFETSYSELVSALTTHLPDVIRSPRNYFILRGSPLYDLLDGHWPSRQIWALLLTTLFVLAIWLIFQSLRGERFKAHSGLLFWGLAAVFSFLIIFADIWILNWA